MGNGESLFDEMSEEPAYILDLVLWSIPIQKFKYLERWSDLETVFFDAKIPLLLLGITLAYAIFNPFGWRRRWGWMITFIVALGIPLPPSLIWDGGWFINGHAFTIGLSTFITLCLPRAYGGGAYIISRVSYADCPVVHFTKYQNPMDEASLCNSDCPTHSKSHTNDLPFTRRNTNISSVNQSNPQVKAYKEMAWGDYSYPSH